MPVCRIGVFCPGSFGSVYKEGGFLSYCQYKTVTFYHKNYLLGFLGKMKVFLFALISLFGCTNTEYFKLVTENGDDACATLSNAYTDYSDTLDTVFRWCYQDERCSRFFQQPDGRRNRTVFEYLANPTILKNNGNVHTPLATIFCSGRTVESIEQELWLLMILASRDANQPLCDVNHRLMVDPASLKTHCECMEDRDCSDSLFDLTLFYVILAILLLMVILFCGTSIYKMWKDLINSNVALQKTIASGLRTFNALV